MDMQHILSNCEKQSAYHRQQWHHSQNSMTSRQTSFPRTLTLSHVLLLIPDPLELIAPGLTAAKLCPLVKSNPQAVVDAIAAGASKAYDEGTKDQYAQALGAAVGAANDNGCINEVFDAVDQAIMKGGYKVEAVVGKALAIGVASGTAGAGDVLAKATAVVICKGGEAASACARAWAQAIKIDPTNGCAVLETAWVYAKAFCSEGSAKTQVQSTFFEQPLGQCGMSEFASGSSPSPDPFVQQGPNGQTVSYPGGGITQNSNGQTVTYNGGSVTQSNNGYQTITGPDGTLVQGPDGMHFYSGRKMLAVISVANAAATNTGVVNGGQVTANAMSTAQGNGWEDILSQANAAATNTGIINGGSLTSNAVSNASG